MSLSIGNPEESQQGKQMSFKRFLENRSKPSIAVSLDDYKEKIEQEIFGHIIVPKERMDEVYVYLLDRDQIENILTDLKYPQVSEFLMAISTRNPAKVRQAHNSLSEWFGDAHLESRSQIDEAMIAYRSLLYQTRTLDEYDAKKIIATLCKESQHNLDRIARQVELATERIRDWYNSELVIRAVPPSQGWVVSEAEVMVGQPPAMTFTYRQTPTGVEIHDVLDDGGFPPRQRQDYASLIAALQNKPKVSRFVTLYTVQPRSERYVYEAIKRDLALGIQATLPPQIILSESIPQNESGDVWRVKLDSKYLREVLYEGDGRHYQLFTSDANIRWIDRVNINT